MKYKKLLIILFSVLYITNLFSQDKYWVCFTDKKDSKFNPFTYFDVKAIERRIKNNISLYDSTDFPLNNNYISKVSEVSEEITSETRWFNAVAVWAYPDQIEKIKQLSFVKQVIPIYYQSVLAEIKTKDNPKKYDETILSGQTERMEMSIFEKHNITGKGLRIAIFDGGFPTVDVNPAFEHIRKEKRIIKTYDFTKKKEFVYSYVSHGTNVLSCIAGIIDGKKIGMAVDAEFLLARTEIVREPFSEEENWLAAVEWADKNGADVINSSLGYTHQRYFYRDMDGKTCFVTRAANLAAAKGIFVVNAAGNEGSGKWKFIGAPADADSALSIGGINPATDYHTSFSSYGPTFDKRMKPNVCAYGHVVAAGKNGLHETQGTSFASPLVAGFVACAWQTNRSLNNMELFNEIQKSADLYPYYDYAHGFGVPQASFFFDKEKKELEPSFSFVEEENNLIIMINKDMIDSTGNNYLFYHIENEEGILDYYTLIDVYQERAAIISLSDLKGNKTIRAHYKKYTAEFELSKN